MAKKSSKGKGSGKPIPKVEVNLEISPEEGEELLKTLQVRFEENMDRHQSFEWAEVRAKLEVHRTYRSRQLGSNHSRVRDGRHHIRHGCANLRFANRDGSRRYSLRLSGRQNNEPVYA